MRPSYAGRGAVNGVVGPNQRPKPADSPLMGITRPRDMSRARAAKADGDG